jgi:threonine dehydrogenase-like Zn-dependent dehydrogenase
MKRVERLDQFGGARTASDVRHRHVITEPPAAVIGLFAEAWRQSRRLLPAGTEVLLKVVAAGVCHSDLHIWDFKLSTILSESDILAESPSKSVKVKDLTGGKWVAGRSEHVIVTSAG